MNANEFYADQHETHLLHGQSRQWERTLQAGDGDLFTPQQLAPYQPVLPIGSYADSAAAIRDTARFWTVLSTLCSPEQIQTLKENFGNE